MKESNIVNRRIPSGESCFASDRCPASINCPIGESRTITNDYSCGYARAFAISSEIKGEPVDKSQA